MQSKKELLRTSKIKIKQRILNNRDWNRNLNPPKVATTDTDMLSVQSPLSPSSINLLTLVHDILNGLIGESVTLEQLISNLYGNNLEDIKPILISLLENNAQLIKLIKLHQRNQSKGRLLGINPVSVNELDILLLLNNIYQEYCPLAQARNLKLNYETCTKYAHGTSAVGDAVNLHRMLSNLLQNALQYTEHGGVFLKLLNDGDDLLISIEDTGVGVTSEDLTNIFLPFYRSSNNQQPGSGLGLYIAKMVAASHGLRLCVESTPGKGTKFTIIFPYKEAKPYGLNDDTIVIKNKIAK